MNARDERSANASRPPAERALVLVVDDEPDDVLIAERELGPRFQVESTGSAVEALERLKGPRRYDLVVLDYRLGDTNALRFLHETNAAKEGVPVIVVSGLDDPRVGDAARELGAYAFVPKMTFGQGALRATAEAALAPPSGRARRDRLGWERSVFSRMSEGLYAVDDEGIVVVANSGLERLTGFGPHEILGLGIEAIMTPDALGAVSACLARGEAFVETELRSRTGAAVPVLVSPSPLVDPGGHVSVVRDFRDHSHRVGELEEANRRLRAGLVEVAVQLLHNVGNAVASLGVQLAAMRSAHDEAGEALGVARLALRKVSNEASHSLRPALGLLEDAIECGECAGTSCREAFVALARAIDHIARSVEQAQVFAGRTRTRDDTLDLARVVETATGLVRDFARSRGFEVAITVPSCQGGRLPIPETGFEQLLLNLLKNAVESVVARATRDPSAPREVSLRADVVDQALRLEVEDTGAGATSEVREHAFEFGFTTRPEGTGFGLHSSAEFVERLGGRIALHSPGPDAGATVRVEIPLVPRTAAGKGAAA